MVSNNQVIVDTLANKIPKAARIIELIYALNVDTIIIIFINVRLKIEWTIILVIKRKRYS